MAGLNVLQLINEPTAAAVAYGQGLQSGPPRTLLVYDLGGGTFDVTLLRVDDSEIQIITSDGDQELGGKDWDSRIIRFLATSFREQFGSDPLGDRISTGQLLVEAERAKIQLTKTQKHRVSIAHDGQHGSYELIRPLFEELTRDLLERTLTLVRAVLESQKLAAGSIDGILLVGGSTRMPMVSDALTKLCGKPPLQGINVDRAVALGAALCAAGHLTRRSRGRHLGGDVVDQGLVMGRRRTRDVTTHSLGMIAVNGDNTAYVNSIILAKDAAIPCKQTRPYSHRTGKAGENYLDIYMTQGEVSSPADVAYLGRYVLHDLPTQANRPLTIEVEYSYDESGSVQVAGRLQGQPETLRLTIEPLPPDVPARFLQPPPQPVVPHVTVYVCINVSGSMAGPPLAEAKRAANGFVYQLDLSHSSVGVISVADSTRVHLKASQNARQIERAIDGLSAGGGNAADPFGETLNLMRGLEGPRFIITLADGVWQNQGRAIQRARDCHKAGIQTIAIGFGQADHSFLRQIASCEEGTLFTGLNDLVSTFTGIARVLTETQGGTASPGIATSAAPESSLWGLLFRKRK